MELTGGLLQAGRCVHHVTMKDDVALALADLAADHRTGVECRSQPWRRPKLMLEFRRRLLKRRHDREEAGDRARIALCVKE